MKFQLIPTMKNDRLKNSRLLLPETPGSVVGIFCGSIYHQYFFIDKKIILHHAHQHTHTSTAGTGNNIMVACIQCKKI
jgi:hypothetical protein